MGIDKAKNNYRIINDYFTSNKYIINSMSSFLRILTVKDNSLISYNVIHINLNVLKIPPPTRPYTVISIWVEEILKSLEVFEVQDYLLTYTDYHTGVDITRGFRVGFNRPTDFLKYPYKIGTNFSDFMEIHAQF